MDHAHPRLESRIDPLYHPVRRPDDQPLTKTPFTQNSGHPQDAGAYVAVGENTVVYVNQDNRYLTAMRTKEKDAAVRVMNEHMFKIGLGLLALAIHKKAATVTPNEAEPTIDAEEFTRMATAAIAPYVVTVIRRLGGADGI